MTRKKKPILALIDGDIVAYQIASSCQTKVDWDDNNEVEIFTDSDEVIAKRLEELVLEQASKIKADETWVCLSDDDHNFRKDILPSYKGNRKEVAKPEKLKFAKDFLKRAFKTSFQKSLEADDVMGKISTDPQINKVFKPIIVSIDKDMETIPGYLYNPSKDKNKPRKITLPQANKNFMYQTLVGDTVDGYKGCPGIGEVNANRILEKAYEEGALWATDDQMLSIMWVHVIAAYESKGFTEEDALVQARCARILRTEDARMWYPPVIINI